MKVLLIASSIHKNGNSEMALEYARKGIEKKGLKTELVKLNEYFFEDGSNDNLSELVDKVQEADGIVWATPVYFGAWTSLAQEFYEYLKEKEISLFPKVVGMISVGAKRNGGQETTITFAVWDLMKLGACIVNDGYPISQFGGTCVAGPIGAMEHDETGKQMCYNLGKRVAETVMIINAGNTKESPYIIEFPIKGDYARCRGCKECPKKTEDDYKCRYDDMRKAHKRIVSADGIMPLRYDLRFQERTRYLRRDNYRLTYHVVFMPEPKFIPVFMKLNCILCREHFGDYVRLVKTGRKKLTLEKQIYEPIGHENPYISKSSR